MIVNIRIRFIKTTDAWGRYIGMAIDEPLEPSWWTAKPYQSLGTTGETVEKIKNVDLTEGTHTIEAGVSSNSANPWDIEIYADEILIGSGLSNNGAFVSASFNVGTEGVSDVPLAKPIDKLKNVWQRIRSFFLGEEGIEAYK